jgi:hypothetical protein
MTTVAAKRGRRAWSELRNHEGYRGRWIAFADVRYDELSREPLDGLLVDADDDITALCARIQAGEHGNCQILFCGEGETGLRRPCRRLARVSA